MARPKSETALEFIKTSPLRRTAPSAVVLANAEAEPTLNHVRQPNGGTVEQEWSKVTVVLFNRQIVYLDRVTNDIRARTGTAIRRAELIRALIDALRESSVDLTSATSETDLKLLLLARLGQGGRERGH